MYSRKVRTSRVFLLSASYTVGVAHNTDPGVSNDTVQSGQSITYPTCKRVLPHSLGAPDIV